MSQIRRILDFIAAILSHVGLSYGLLILTISVRWDQTAQTEDIADDEYGSWEVQQSYHCSQECIADLSQELRGIRTSI